jgi:Xaa-Pro aminopeptidase
MDRDKEYLIVPNRSASREAFDGAVGSEDLSRRSGVKDVYDERSGWRQLGSRLKKVKHVATLAVPPVYDEQHGLYTNPARKALVKKLKQQNPELQLLDILPHLVRQRIIKQPVELAAIQEAINITIATIKETTAPAKLRSYVTEYQVEAELSRGFRRRGASGHAFEPIVAGGRRACVLHNVANNGLLAKNELLLIDCGAEVEHYAADITRTISLSGPSRRQQAVHAAVLSVQKFAFELLGPGVVLRDYEQQIESFMGEKLRELGLIKTINHAAVREYFPHGTSHFLGLNVHDAGDYSRPLEPGMVITVEPGIYIAPEAIGVRIEDDVVITSKGIKILSNKLPGNL